MRPSGHGRKSAPARPICYTVRFENPQHWPHNTGRWYQRCWRCDGCTYFACKKCGFALQIKLDTNGLRTLPQGHFRYSWMGNQTLNPLHWSQWSQLLTDVATTHYSIFSRYLLNLWQISHAQYTCCAMTQRLWLTQLFGIMWSQVLIDCIPIKPFMYYGEIILNRWRYKIKH